MKQGDITIQGQAAVLPVAKIGAISRVMTDASGTVAYTGVGFKPSVIIFHGSIDNSDSVSWGFGDGATIRRALFSNDGVLTTLVSNSTGAITIILSAGNLQTAYINSSDSDGFTLNWTKSGSPTGTATINYLAFK